MAHFVVKVRRTGAPQEMNIEADTPEAAVEEVIAAVEEAADGSSVEILQVTPGAPEPEVEPPADEPAEAPAEEPATA